VAMGLDMLNIYASNYNSAALRFGLPTWNSGYGEQFGASTRDYAVVTGS